MPIYQKTSRRLAEPAPSYDFLAGLINGALANRICGIGVHILISEDHFFCIKMGRGQSTNTRSELLALWVLLVFSYHIGLPYINIRGDSLVTINWFNGQDTLFAFDVDGWCHIIRDLQNSFIHLHSAHVFR